MRHSASEKMEIIRTVEESELGVKRTLEELDVPRSSFYRWYRSYQEGGYEALADQPPAPRRFWNRIPESEREHVVEVALEHPDLSPRELAWRITDVDGTFISESSVYRILKDADLVTSPAFMVLTAHETFPNPTKRVHELWQTDFTYLKVNGWGWYYLATVLDDYSRYIITWSLCTSMASDDVEAVLDDAIARTGVTHPTVRQRPRLLTDNGPCYVSGQLRDYLEDRGIGHTRGRPYHPMTQGKIERYHRTMKNVIKLRNYYLPGDLKREIERFVGHYNEERAHESLDNLTPSDVYEGRGREIRTAREMVKRETMRRRRRYNKGLPARKEKVIRPAEVREVSLRMRRDLCQMF
jgi:transposase InsO family protein